MFLKMQLYDIPLGVKEYVCGVTGEIGIGENAVKEMRRKKLEQGK